MKARYLRCAMVLACLSQWACGPEEEDEANSVGFPGGCVDCYGYPESNEEEHRGIAGAMYFDSVPASIEEARFFALVDEVSTYSKERTRIIEREFETELDDDYPPGYCDVGEASHDVGYGCYAYYPTCGSGSGYGMVTLPRASIDGELDVVSSIDFTFDYDFPDVRSKYFFGVLVDMDGDGKAGPGDYISEEFLEVRSGQHPEGVSLVLNLIDAELETLFSVDIVNMDEIALPDGREVKAVIRDAVGGRALVEAVLEIEAEKSRYEVVGHRPIERTHMVVELHVDSNENGEVDAGDLVSAGEVTVDAWGDDVAYEVALELVE